MNIAQALKTKNRIVGEMNRVLELIQKHNSYITRDDVDIAPVKVDSKELYLNQYNALYEKLVRLKAEIQKASAPIAEKLVRLAETKSLIANLSRLSGSERVEVREGRDGKMVTIKYVSQMNDEFIEAEKVKLQNLINLCQDEVDNFNATTTVNFAE